MAQEEKDKKVTEEQEFEKEIETPESVHSSEDEEHLQKEPEEVAEQVDSKVEEEKPEEEEPAAPETEEEPAEVIASDEEKSGPDEETSKESVVASETVEVKDAGEIAGQQEEVPESVHSSENEEHLQKEPEVVAEQVNSKVEEEKPEEAESTTPDPVETEEEPAEVIASDEEKSISDEDSSEEAVVAPEIVEAKEESETAEPKKETADVTAQKAGEDKQEEDHDDGEEKHDQDSHDEHHLDYSNYSKTQLVQAIESQLKNTDMSEVGKILKEIKPAFDDIHDHEREDAFQKFLETGGEKDDFEYKNDEYDARFLEAFNKLRERKNSFYNDLEKQKDQNLAKKQAVLEKLRDIVDSDETMASLKDLKEIQEEWKNTGSVAPQHLKSLWANYNALIDRYYDKRSIYFELKELDRKKNLEAKLELCEKAEKLETEDIKEAIKTLNELHDEFKHMGPVPKEDQETIWTRFKSASDAVYSRRKDYYESLKEELKVNQIAKESLAEKVQPFLDFNSDKISEWNQKTKEILEVQREWEAIGGLPRELAKKINKKFWTAFKTFFNHKGQFFKQIEKARQENLKIKEELVEEADALKDSDDFHQTAEKLKELQRQWRDIGPVPEKFRNEIYGKFKAACDHFFNRRRQTDNVQEKEYVENLKKKESLCAELEQMAKDDTVDIGRVEDILEEYAGIGFVPKQTIKSIQSRYQEAIAAAMEKTNLSEDDRQRVKLAAQYSKLKFGPNSHRIIQKKENTLRRQIAKLENDIDLWRNNLDFFAQSKTADKLKEEFNEKIEKASKELHNLEEQLRAISNI